MTTAETQPDPADAITVISEPPPEQEGTELSAIASTNGVREARVAAYARAEQEYQTSMLPASLWAEQVGDTPPTRAQHVAAGMRPGQPMPWLDYDCLLVQQLDQIEYPEG